MLAGTTCGSCNNTSSICYDADMPYIAPFARRQLDPAIEEVAKLIRDRVDGESRDGWLNYVITKLLIGLYRESYTEFNAAVGVLECAKQEFYRRAVEPYEDKKVIENGDVY